MFRLAGKVKKMVVELVGQSGCSPWGIRNEMLQIKMMLARSSLDKITNM
jgi:hypothetical protein